MSFPFPFRGPWALAACVALTALPCAAQGNTEQSPTAEPDTIIVTATRREQALSEVPISITALSGDELEARGLDTLTDIARLTPNMSMFSGSPSSRYIQLRGISTTAGRPAVGYTLDDISLSSFTVFQADPFLFDLDRVEILRGPQGTLFGEGAMGGSVRLITHQPEFGLWDARARLRGAFTRDGDPSHRADVAANIPFGTLPLALRLTGTRDVRGGFIHQPAQDKRDANREDRTEGRITLRAEPFKGTQLRAMAAVKDISYGASSVALDDYSQDARIPTGSSDDMRLYNVALEQDVGFGTVLVSQSRFDRDFSRITDARADLPAALGLDFAPVNDVVLTAVNAVEILDAGDSLYDTTELRFTTRIGTWLDGVAGFYYANKRDEQLARWLVDLDENLLSSVLPILAPLLPGLPNLPQFPLLDQTYLTDQTQYAGYIHADIHLTRYLSLALGTRYTVETIKVVTQGTSSFIPTDGRYEDKLNVFTPRAHLALHLDRLAALPDLVDQAMLYVSAARGFRSGGANAAVSGPLGSDVDPVYGPDFLWTYEAGAKVSLLNGKLILEVAVYYNDWTDVQAWVAGDLFPFIKNVGDASGFGVDAALGIGPFYGVSLTLTGGYNGVTFSSQTNDKAKGDPTDNAARWTGSAALSIRHTFAWGLSGFVLADYSYEGKSFYTYRSAAIRNEVGPLHFINARIGIEHRFVTLAFYADNLTDYRGRVDANAAPGEEAVRPRPRTIGLDLTLALN